MRTYFIGSRAIVSMTILGLMVACNQSLAQERENPRVEVMKSTRTMDRTIIRTIAKFMYEQHLSKHPLDDEISERAFDQMLRSLDPLKLYFLKEDIDAFKSNRTQLDEFAKVGNMDFARELFMVFLKRVDERGNGA